MIVFLLTLALQEANDPLWAQLIEARVTRNSARINARFAADDDLDDNAKRQYLLTLGQIGDPRDIDRIASFFEDRDLQDAALLAYGEVDGAPFDKLFAIRDKVRGPNMRLYAEAVSKLAGPTDEKAINTIWAGFNRAQRNESLFYFWRLASESLTRSVLQRLDRDVSDRLDGYVYFLYRAGIEVDPALLLAILQGVDGDEQTLIHALRIIPREPSDALIDKLVSVTRSNDWRVKVNAIRALGRIDDEQTLEVGRRFLRDRNPNVVEAAANALLQLEENKGLKPVADAMKKMSPGVQAAVMAIADENQVPRLYQQVGSWYDGQPSWQKFQSFGHVAKADQRDRIPDLTQKAREGYTVFSSLAIDALAQMKALDKETVRAALQSGDVHRMSKAVSAMAQLKDTLGDAVPIVELDKLAAKRAVDPDFHRAYLGALPTLAGENAQRDAVQKMLAHPDYPVRLAALSTISEPTLEQRTAVIQPGWQPRVPPIVTGLAARMIATDQEYLWTIVTDQGEIVIQMNPESAPITCANIVYLASKDTFNGMPIHRVVPNFVVQAGDTRGDGSGGPGYAIPCEINANRFERGSVGMALSGKDTGGSQFFICHSDQPHLDGGYTVFGRVTKGLRVLDKLEEGATIIRTRIN